MAQQKLSPEKYICTKARSLAIDACYVNPAWETNKLANVAVVRRHTHGHFTVGVYMVDLLCLGVKDTFYFFNKETFEIEDRFDFSNAAMWKKIEYGLAHNIIYAGHDFAMDYHITPHKDFAVTKFILEEDNDEVPLIDIETGDENGKPFLMASLNESYGSVLAKLKQYAGQGNYTFILNDAGFDDFDESDYDEEDEEEEEEEDNDDDDAYWDYADTVENTEVKEDEDETGKTEA